MIAPDLGRDQPTCGQKLESSHKRHSQPERAGLGDSGAGSLGLDLEQGAR